MPNHLKILTKLLRTPKSERELQMVIADLFTESEITTLLERWNALSLLLDGVTHRQVQRDVGISISKVTHAANLLKTGGKGARLLHLKTKP